MTSTEQRLHDALRADHSGRASPDLFARVLGSIDDDRARRRRLRINLAIGAALAAALAATILIATPRENGSLVMDWWILELMVTALLVGLALWLGPFIKRFGRAYAADVFHDNPQTGKSYIVLTDIVYYLIFTAYILFTVRLEPIEPWLTDVTAQQVRESAVRVGGILLIIGVLHGLNIVLMPILGRLFSLNRHLSERRQ
jgi:hypothetical protein